MTMHADLATIVLQNLPQDGDRTRVIHHGIGEKVRRNAAKLMEQLLQGGKPANDLRRCIARLYDSPLVFFHVNRDDQFHEQLLITDTPF